MNLTLAQAIKRGNNNFDLIRLLAAIAVIYGHSFSVFPPNGQIEFVSIFPIGEYSGSLAVYIFFFLSGVLITASFVNSKNSVRFIIMRIFRIWPALIVCVFITFFIIGPIFTVLTLNDYFLTKHTWKYLTSNVIMLKFEPRLSGVFENNRFTDAIDGSLWTLPTEIRCYIMILVTGMLGLLKRKSTVIALFLLFLIFQSSHYLSLLVFGGLIKQMIFFLAGTLAYKLRDYIIIEYRIAITLIVCCLAAFYINHILFLGLFYCAFLYTVVFISTTDTIKRFRLPGDYSYGVYIYGFLTQQIVAHFLPKLSSYPSMLLTIPITLILGIISWYYIELPSLNFAKKLVGKYNYSIEGFRKLEDA